MLYLLAIFFPILAGITFLVRGGKEEEQKKTEYGKLRYLIAVLIADICCVCAVCLSKGAQISLPLVDKVSLSFAVDGFGKLMLTIALCLFTLICCYALVYMEKEERTHIFFGCFLLTMGALIGVCLSANLITMYLCFEMTTLLSVPLVLHEMTKESVQAGIKYLFYSVGGALMGLCAVIYIYSITDGDMTFLQGGFLSQAAITNRPVFLLMMFLGILGFGTKAGIYPMHSWLPTAHPIAPAPASALLSGIIAKAGIIALVRLIYYSVGPQLLFGSVLQKVWLVLAMITVLLGSSMALISKDLKKRLAYSTVSQLSYIMVALACFTWEGLTGGLLQVLAHAFAKCCLFLVAGAIIHMTGLRDVRKLSGLGKKMPVTMWCFAFAALSLIGIPPMGGFLAKWNIAAACLQTEKGVWSVLPPIVLLISALLTAAYLMPVVVSAFFPEKIEADEAKDNSSSQSDATKKNKVTEKVLPETETEQTEKEPLLMSIPMIALCVLAALVGVFGEVIVGLLL
ncbi:MAG: proton-conducting membrane transporter [Lachnospiraceae bacterium]|nr:proton-conducting membrane transporter [Lachnospiraceae bacterium]